jgi:putative nucleotidyltransferase with HDIG domain
MHLQAQQPERYLGYRPVLLMLAALVGISIVREWWLVGLMALEIYCLLLHYLGLQASAELQYAKKVAEEVSELHLRTIEGLASAINAKDNTTHEHLARVVVYAEAIGQEMALQEDELQALRTAALLHDIGKLAVPEHIISKPGRLTEEEFEKMNTHTLVGAEIQERVRFPYPVVPIVRSHHERWNGSGYPDGLKGEEIPVGARILAVVDSFDALSSDRQYRRALSRQDALDVIKKNSGILYDPKVVEIFERIYPRLESLVKSFPQFGANLSTGVRIERGVAPTEGLSVERVTDTSSALCSIAQARKELQILYELTQALGNSLSVDDTLRLLVDKLRELIPYDTIAVYFTHEGKLVPRFVEGVNDWLVGRMQIPLGEGVSGWVAAQGKYSLNGNPAVEPGYVEVPRRFSRFRSALSVPLDSAKGIIGALTLYSSHPNAFTVDHLRILKSVGMKAGSTLQNALRWVST